MAQTYSVDNEFNAPGFSPAVFVGQMKLLMKYVRSKWWVILLCGLLAAVLGYWYISKKDTKYTAEATLTIDEDVALAAPSDLAKLSSEMGLGEPFDAGAVFSTVTNIVELMQSRILVTRTLCSHVELPGGRASFADFFLDSLALREKWVGKVDEKLRFTHGADSLQWGKKESRLLQQMHKFIVTEVLKIDRKGKGTTIISVTCATNHELFSKLFLESLLQQVTAYYVNTKTQRAQATLNFMQHRTDSVRRLYLAALYGSASFADGNQNLVRQTIAATGEKRLTDVQILRANYIELARSLESAKAALSRTTPLIQYIDKPMLPLPAQAPAPVRTAILFFIIGCLIALCGIIAFKVGKFLLSLDQIQLHQKEKDRNFEML